MNFLRNATRGFSTSRVVKQITTFGDASKNPEKIIKEAKQAKQVKDIKTVKHVLHCSFKKNNTFITLTKVEMDKNWPANNPNTTFNEQVLYFLQLPEKIVISQSTGYLGFRKAQRGE